MTTENCHCQDIKYTHDETTHIKLTRSMAIKKYTHRQKQTDKYTSPYPDLMNELERFKQIECAEFGEEYILKHYTFEELPKGEYWSKERKIKK